MAGTKIHFCSVVLSQTLSASDLQKWNENKCYTSLQVLCCCTLIEYFEIGLNVFQNSMVHTIIEILENSI